MARRHEPLGARAGPPVHLWPGGLALAATLGLALLSLTALVQAAPARGELPLLDRYALRIVGFTLWQAALSTLLSLAFALPVARALARRPAFPGRGLLLGLFGLPLVMPTIVAVVGIAAIWGRNGLAGRALDTVGLPPLSPLYGLAGILIAHVFFNMPLAVRLLLPALAGHPGESWRLAAQLGMGPGALFRWVEWPRLAALLPAVAALIFLLCFTSFTVVLALGGGPGAATLEVAIYQALRLDFDLPRAVFLALLQLAICALLASLLALLGRVHASEPAAGIAVARPDAATPASRAVDAGAISLAALWVLLPLAATVAEGLAGPVSAVLERREVWLAAGRSLAVGLAAGGVAVTLGAALAWSARDIAVRRGRPRQADRLELGGSLTLVVSPTVFGAGLFVLLLWTGDVFAFALPLAAVVNGIVAVPYVLRLLGPPLRRTAEHHDRLCAGLGIGGGDRLRLVEWPAARRGAALALALSAALGTGDLTVIALFGNQDSVTLPLLLYRALGSYRSGEAAVLALLLALLCLAVFLVIERGIDGRARTPARRRPVRP